MACLDVHLLSDLISPLPLATAAAPCRDGQLHALFSFIHPLRFHQALKSTSSAVPRPTNQSQGFIRSLPFVLNTRLALHLNQKLRGTSCTLRRSRSQNTPGWTPEYASASLRPFTIHRDFSLGRAFVHPSVAERLQRQKAYSRSFCTLFPAGINIRHNRHGPSVSVLPLAIHLTPATECSHVHATTRGVSRVATLLKGIIHLEFGDNC